MSDRVELRQVSKVYEGVTVVETLDLSMAAGEFVVLLGPSGSGKTTLLNMIGGFANPTAGQVLIDGEDVTELPPAKRPTATVFQDEELRRQFGKFSSGGGYDGSQRLRRVLRVVQ